MPYSESLAARVRDVLAGRRDIVEKRMFGGTAFLLRGNMLVCIWHASLIVRLGPQEAATRLAEPYVKEFDITGRPMKGWIMVEPDALESDLQLGQWIERAIPFVSRLPRK